MDSLTGLKNRRAADKDIKIELERNIRYGTPLSVLLIDIDKFKRINDTYGHGIGDKVIAEISKMLKENTRISDTVSRWGGEEFLILAANSSLQNSVKLAEKIRIKIQESDFIENTKVTVSIGVAEYLSGEKFDRMFERADKALYSAKDKGRNRVEY